VEVGPDGRDEVCFLFGANPGEPPAPLADVASGGELSRVQLALDRAVAAAGAPPTAVYDEVDAGLSGGGAVVLGRYLAEVAAHQQVLCVSHLPQVAAAADSQVVVSKGSCRGRTASRTAVVTGSERVREIARMLGQPDGPEALAHAEALLRASTRAATGEAVLASAGSEPPASPARGPG
jgi:DNA repair protein RecN (Recombination protein N)